MHLHEKFINVAYPQELDDTDITSTAYLNSTTKQPLNLTNNERSKDEGHWMHGWLFSLDLLRILSRYTNSQSADDILASRPSSTSKNTYTYAQQRVHALQTASHQKDTSPALVNLEDFLKKAPSRLETWKREQRVYMLDFKDEILDIQACNLNLTYNLVHLALWVQEVNSKPDKNDGRIEAIGNVLDEWSKIPWYSLVMISTTHVHHLKYLTKTIVKIMKGPTSGPHQGKISILQARRIASIL